MDAFVTRKSQKRRRDPSPAPLIPTDEDSTDLKLALLASLCPCDDSNVLLEALLAAEGSVEAAADLLKTSNPVASPRKKHISEHYQSSLAGYALPKGAALPAKRLTKKGQTLHLFSPEDVAAHTPCSIIHNFLPTDVADALLRELLDEAPTYSTDTFRMFEKVVTSPHTFCFYVDDWDEAEQQKTQYVYNGGRVNDVRRTLPHMRNVSGLVREAVNKEIQQRIKTHYPDGKKLKYQMSSPWEPNTAFVNCYDGGKESVGYHSDQLTYLGPRAVIGSLSLGATREFRVRRIVPRDPSSTDPATRKADAARADEMGQIAIHLPHNSLCVMHAECQEEWKHSIAPAPSITPHPLAGNKRLNITYRYYRASFHPRFTPRCKCNVPTVLRCVQKREVSRGNYVWMCHAGLTPDALDNGCGYFQWAVFDDEGEPPWSTSKLDSEGDGERERKSVE